MAHSYKTDSNLGKKKSKDSKINLFKHSKNGENDEIKDVDTETTYEFGDVFASRASERMKADNPKLEKFVIEPCGCGL